jgi:hypothetical protein
MLEARKTLHTGIILMIAPRRLNRYAGRHGVLACSLLATLPLCFANKHTHTGLRPYRVDRVAIHVRPKSVELRADGEMFDRSKAQRSEP